MNNYPPGMTMREFDRANHDPEEDCVHETWGPDCGECKATEEADRADDIRDEIYDREFDREDDY